MPSKTFAKVRNTKESKHQLVLGQYLRETRMTGFFELKVASKENFFFNKIENPQYLGLQATEKEGLFWKLSDQDQRQKPCDCIGIPPMSSYIVIKFKDGFYMIRIKEIVKLRDDGLVSISKDQAEQLAEKIIKIETE